MSYLVWFVFGTAFGFLVGYIPALSGLQRELNDAIKRRDCFAEELGALKSESGALRRQVEEANKEALRRKEAEDQLGRILTLNAKMLGSLRAIRNKTECIVGVSIAEASGRGEEEQSDD